MRSRLLLLVLAAFLAAVPAALAGPSANPAERLVDLPIDDEAYDHATDCRKGPSAGALALVEWLEANAAGESWGIMRCERWGKGRASLHAEGRAVDWHLDARVAADRREARRLIDLFLAADSAGNERALARRMGIQELIWNCRSWWSGSDGMEPYSGCFTERGARRRGVSPTAAHRDHIHIGLSRAGARRRTSFWAR